MEILQRCLTVELSSEDKLQEEQHRQQQDDEAVRLVLSHQPLHFRLSITFTNENGKHNRDGAALLAAFGENDFGIMWNKLFRTLRIAPFIVHSPGASNQTDSTFTFGPSAFWTARQSVNIGTDLGPSQAATAEPSFASNTPESHAAGRIFLVSGETATLSAGHSSADRRSSVDAVRAALTEAVPERITSTYHFSHILPDLGELAGSVELAYVILLPSSTTTATEATEERDSEDDEILMQAFVPPGDRSTLAVCRPASMVLGTCHRRVCIGRVLQCSSISRAARRFRVIVNVQVTNVAEWPICVRQVTFDICSTWIGDSLGSLSNVPLWAEQRAGPRGLDMRAVDVLRSAVTITPIVVAESRVPAIVQPEECMSFQYAIQIKPHLRHLLEPHTLRDVYGPFIKAASPNASTLGTTAPFTDIPREEIVQVLSSNFTSHVYVHYELMTTDEHAVANNTEDDAISGLHLRHSVHWSMMQ